MPTKKISDLDESETWKARCRQVNCQHAEHSPPKMRVFGPGVYEHTCPACGAVAMFTVAPAARLG